MRPGYIPDENEAPKASRACLAALCYLAPYCLSRSYVLGATQSVFPMPRLRWHHSRTAVPSPAIVRIR